ncbi:MAG: amidohydrolase family protein [Chloroflexi bacterium]|nr:amidohydrolase family protein [Chloroflexota bacterium]
MLDLVIKGGQVVTPERVAELEIGVQGGKIVVVAQPGAIPVEARRTLDASGKIVTPGGIEPHAHIFGPVPRNWAGQDGVMTQSPDAATRAAAFGGTTTVLDFALAGHGVEPLAAVEGRRAQFRGHAYIDYSFHCTLRGAVPDTTVAQIKDAIASGIVSFKVFTTFARREPPLKVEDGHLWAIMAEVARHGGIMAVHAEDDEIVTYMEEKLKREGRDQWHNIHLVHNNLSEDVSFRKVLRIAGATGAGVYFVHVTAKEGVAAIAEARAEGRPVYGEALHHYLCFTSEDYKKPDGGKYHTYPALKFPEDRDAMWDGLVKGNMSTVATDEYTTSYAVKTWGKTVDTVCGGHAGLETRAIVAFSEGYSKGRFSLQRFVEVTSSNAAKILGLYPQKGAIAVGSDADIALWDPGARKRIALADLHHDSDYSIWEGWEVQGWPVVTILRGKVIVENGELLGSPSDGQWLKRKVASEVLARPAC